MLNQIVNRLQGQVRIRVETPFPERVLNLCGARNLAFWDMEWESETAFTCRLNRRDYYALRRAVKQLDCRLTVVRKEGVPFFLGRFRRRHALLAGLTLCSALLFFGSFFIWDFTVEGNQRVTDEEILRALDRAGVLCEEGQPANVQAWIRQDQSARYSRTVHLGIVVFRVVSDKDHALKNPLKQFSNIFSEQLRVSSEKRAYRFRNSSPYGVSSL